MSARPAATYDLAEIQTKIRAGLFWITHSSRTGAAAAGLAETDVVSCVLALTNADFYETMESDTTPGLWQDVYRPVYSQISLYVKLQIAIDGDAIVISFKVR